MKKPEERELLIRDFADQLDWNKGDGLLPAIIQDAASGAVLMLGFMNRTALVETLLRGRVVFWSRTRNCLWEKGETSGNTLELIDMDADCDWDSLLVTARPQGPVCHTGAQRCFSDNPPCQSAPFEFLERLESIIASRESAAADTSYTASLFAAGSKRMAQKVGEEGVEVALAASAGDQDELLNESADLLFHLAALLRAKGASLKDVVNVLEKRHAAPK